MNKHIIFALVLCIMALCGCSKTVSDEIEGKNTEKPIIYPDDDDGDEGNDYDPNGGNDNEGDVNTNDSTSSGEYMDVLSVAEAQAHTENDAIYVKGYIVGACKVSIGNADFDAPFDDHTAILLSDTPFDADTIAANFRDGLFPVKIKEYTEIYEFLNLTDHPELLNRQIILYGHCTYYMRRRGMDKVLGFTFP